jgi:hypothetical protein
MSKNGTSKPFSLFRTSRTGAVSDPITTHPALGPCVIKALGNAFTTAQLGNAGFATQAIQNNADFLLSRIVLASCPVDILHDPLRRRFTVFRFVSHLHSLMVTMSQKSSVLQPTKSVSQALMPNT